MTKIIIGEDTSQVVIEGYKVTVKVTDKPLSLTDILDDLLGRKLEKI
ncbi:MULTISPECIES: hypothetical protein [Streptococcus]|uniref:Uncharacterized protein n=2 Tax=Streptococcus TaxID=1301 RepID=A0AB37G4F4_STRSU|nr:MULTISPECIES: hypothetical protein [Streptococcus]ESV54007.1 hypothetical protein SAG0136_01745 [Streptococcus agalactiae LMG 14747]MBM7138025.1 hypothetical protein [Streptococcus suis]MBM7180141.1 hypothetical protein [Streptococcus suis]MBM7284621.1 hypothetical protein [Streptococcus suis]MBY4600807.1 hypothetical protein [Streptococcus suis]